MVTITDLAADKLKEILQDEGHPESSLRIVVMPGPHGGVQYMLTLEEQPKTDDSLIHSNGVNVVVDTDSISLVEGAEIDYVEGLMRSGFVINNPNFETEEGGGCACGGNCACGGH
ncbi:iron-sulfur cluster assembly accessory protein [Dehalococcoidia bacterium]|nr:iron-sulfur cluster assembly accessory protein [Dehalococcoidia bacterium]